MDSTFLGNHSFNSVTFFAITLEIHTQPVIYSFEKKVLGERGLCFFVMVWHLRHWKVHLLSKQLCSMMPQGLYWVRHLLGSFINYVDWILAIFDKLNAPNQIMTPPKFSFRYFASFNCLKNHVSVLWRIRWKILCRILPPVFGKKST